MKTIPEELQARPQWVVWAYRQRNGHHTKVPYSPKTGQLAAVDNPASWSTYAEARAALATRQFSGPGFVFTPTDPYCGIDLDHCIHEGQLVRWAHVIVDHLASYTELSPSGEGLHLLIRAALPGDHHRTGAIELYDSNRYFTLTGNLLPGAFSTIEERQEELERLYWHLFQKPGEQPPVQRPKERVPDLADETLIRRALSATNGMLFARLWQGDASLWEGQRAPYSSQSEADLALCGLLAFQTGGDAMRMDTLFRQSGLMRPKWDEQRGPVTYGQRTIACALAGRQERYRPAFRSLVVPIRVAPTKEAV